MAEAPKPAGRIFDVERDVAGAKVRVRVAQFEFEGTPEQIVETFRRMGLGLSGNPSPPKGLPPPPGTVVTPGRKPGTLTYQSNDPRLLFGR